MIFSGLQVLVAADYIFGVGTLDLQFTQAWPWPLHV